MRLFLVGLFISFFLIQESRGMQGDFFDREEVGASRVSVTQTLPFTLQERYQPSLTRQLRGYILRGMTISVGTLIGASLGFCMVSNAYTYDDALIIVKMGAPIIIGSTLGSVMAMECLREK